MRIVRLKKVDSTNLEAFRLLEETDFVVVSADTQTEGYGRNKSKWISSEGNIHLSIGKAVKVETVKHLSIYALYKVFGILRNYTQGKLKVKWPNDILLNGKKLGGILVESKIKGHKAKVVIGVGVNYAFAPIETGASLGGESNVLKGELEQSLVNALADVFREQPDFAEILSFIEENSFFKIGDLIQMDSGGTLITGIFKGYSSDFAIVLESDGKELFFYSGEVKKVRKS